MVDGNTVDIQYRNRTGETVRLLGVETCDISPTRTSPHEWEEINRSPAGRDRLAERRNMQPVS
ncbi:MAG: hypothetical protein J07HQX50_00105 [Haloquadratum sp. J07HQX50]|nr:MAG: hypothetical protein J07HQX50_00105 [Haloquadratum sp. J07HQX50]